MQSVYSLTPRNAYTLLEIMVVVSLIGMLAAIAIPYALKPRSTTQSTVCIKYLQLIEAGKEQLAFEFNLPNGTTVTESSVNAYIKNSVMPACPASGSYSYSPIGSNPTCNIDGHVLPD